ncbi:MAG: phosphate signaling complex protein PhoU [Deltaproteobacteria bacterium]|nr:phosphate signaling complex protein PhoU [Deltaproteobacteria bacterium]
MAGRHTSGDFELELREIRAHLVAMGARCERAVQLALAAFLDRDSAKIAEVSGLDQKVNQDEIDLDDMALRVLALRQPVAYDLRFIASTLKFVTDLERISDEAVNIAERVETLQKATTAPPVFDLPRMGELAQKMLREALDAFVEGDEQRARKVLTADDDVDALYGQTLRAALAWMAEHPNDIPAAMCVASAAKYLERIADHATNLAEHVIFLEKGDDVRHRRSP